jgi:hypothetical protein
VASGAMQQLKNRSTMVLRRCVMSLSPSNINMTRRGGAGAWARALSTRLLIWQYMLQILRGDYLRGMR